MYQERTNTNGKHGEILTQTSNAIPMFKYNHSVKDSILPTSRRQSMRSVDKVEEMVDANFTAFQYEFKRKPYASFNNYSVIPPIKNKSSNTQQTSSENHSEPNVQMLLEQEIHGHTQKRLNFTNRSNSINTEK